MESPPALSRNGPVFSQIGSELRMWKEIWKEWWAESNHVMRKIERSRDLQRNAFTSAMINCFLPIHQQIRLLTCSTPLGTGWTYHPIYPINLRLAIAIDLNWRMFYHKLPVDVYFVYILLCSDNSYYTGLTDDLDQRYLHHQLGEYPTCYTFKRRPVTLKYFETIRLLDSLRMHSRKADFSTPRSLIAAPWLRSGLTPFATTSQG